ncbi:MAG: hypothetical protein JWQ29_1925 [Phenylobacterium sp.]|nr:hypothetical protein [Phenylobacterium sp.]
MLASRTHWRLLVGTILVLMAAAWLAPLWIKPPDIQENRVLAQRPPWPKGLSDIHAFRIAADPYVADNFPVRPHLIGLLNRLRMTVGVSGSPRVVVGRDGWLFFDDGTHLGSTRNDPPLSGPEIRNWLRFLAGRTETLQARGIRYLVVAAPVKEAVYPQFTPSWFGRPSPERATLVLPKLAAAAGVGDVLYLYPPIAAATRAGQKTYSRHDTHWTGYGAYAGYAGLMRKLQAMGVTEGPLPLSAFDQIGGNPKARPRDLALMLGVASFVHIDFPHIDNLKGESRMRVTYLSDKQDWTGPQLVDTGEVGKPVLMMTRDSFSNELLPLLFPHFSRIILTHNQDGFWRPELIDKYKPDVVIMEVVEHGLRVGMGDGPVASAAATARIDRLLASMAPIEAPSLPKLAAPNPFQRLAFAASKPTSSCNLESASLAAGGHGEATVSVSGWVSELGPRITSPEGLVRLQGPGVDLAAPLRVDGSRPDVAKVFNKPTGEFSGFLGTYFVRSLPAGVYQPTIYRRAPRGWIACVGRQPLVKP